MIWLRRIGLGLGLGAWWFVVFVVVWRLTFPGAALARYAQYKFQEASGGAMLLDVDRIVPSVLPPGLYGSDVHLVSKDKPRRGKEGEAKELIGLDAVAVHLNPFTVLSWLGGGGLSVGGTATLRGGDLDFWVQLVRGEKGTRIGSLSLTAGGFPVSAIPIASGTRLEGAGGFDIDIELDAADGLSKANGKIELHAKDLTLEKIIGTETIEIASVVGSPIAIESFDVVFAVENGKAKVTTGEVHSDVAEIMVDGDVTLRDDLLGSILRLKVVIGLADKMKSNPLVKAALDAGHWEADDKYHYQISGALRSPKPPRPDRERRARAARNPRAPREPGMDMLPREPFVPGGPGGPPGGPGDPGPEIVPPDEAARRDRTAQRERLIEERRARLRDRLGPNAPDDPDGPMRPPRIGGDEPPIDEPLPPGLEDGPIDEPPFDPNEEP